MNTVNNFYCSSGVKAFTEQYDNPKYGEKHYIPIPFRSILVGSSGSMKTNTLMNIIKRMSKTFDHIILCCKSSHEPLYQWLIDKLKDNIDVYEGGDIPDLNDVDNNYKDCQVLAIFDDLVNDKAANQQITEWYIRSRKCCKGVSCMYISQNYYSVPKIIRSNTNLLFLKKLSSTRDLTLILSENNLANVDIKLFKKLYKECTTKKEDFMMIDIDNNTIYHNFMKNITPPDEFDI